MMDNYDLIFAILFQLAQLMLVVLLAPLLAAQLGIEVRSA